MPAPVLVTGATGQQGGATTRALLAAGIPVRALVRDPTTTRAKAVEALGAELITGNLNNRDSITSATQGARAVFSVQMPAFTGEDFDFEGEVTQGINLIEAAKAAGVPQFVHTSVTGAGQHTETPGWSEGRWPTAEPSMTAKTKIQDHLRKANFPRWTLLKPGMFMENFLPTTKYLFPKGIEAGLITVLKPETRLSLIAVHDIGTAAAAAITNPDKFHEVELELASDYLSMTEIAETLSKTLNIPLTAPNMTTEEALAAGMPPMGTALDRLNVAGQPGRPHYATDLGIPITTFATWTKQHLTT